MIKVGIIGGAGYTGGELIRLLINHPQAEIVFVNSKSNAGNLISFVHQDLIGETDLKFSNSLSFGEGRGEADIDVLFLCLGHGDSRKFLEENNIPDGIKVIDLANDFRLNQKSEIRNRKFIYGLPEINKTEIQSAQSIANPGCFATSIQLGLLPLAKANLLNEIYTTGITGSTGAGQKLAATSHFSWRANNIQAYKTLTHQHLGEIQQSLHQLQNSFPLAEENSEALSFVPWRGDFTRGIFISSTVTCKLTLAELNDLYKDFYKDTAFTFVSDEPIFLKQVVNTNKAVIYLEKVGTKLVVHSALDNLLKGASGQAVQNMNLMFGLEETTGLKLKATGF
ncbi:N-acetyl-gamma-glutamyl-phosphate reductase [Arachidicoccus ginsenosidimutans]|uniref:N-acetyl-gamma-glutamyl-phosphate reductase n=1 Tax=Arachidicoccus sp. BS20 TaxID=1850526 RepID=UPI0007F14802|nr:N-acetyl-gamma-glutamyl-phosphate reductase [Arachidicoccus sp. BS20]ANI89140.1 N-acetyl-gamma-glutamyl-phosphate reductase [Arachidicoccus sp. BS20]